ncbi:unnamed protein product [Closterium sp. NIES-53]
MWMWLGIAAVLFALTILFLERHNNSLFLQHPVEGATKAERCRSKAFSLLQDFWEALWISFQSYFLVPIEVHTLLARVPVLVWYGLVLILSTSYTANLTSIYTINLLTPPLQSVGEAVVRGSIIGYQAGSFIRSYLLQIGLKPSQLVPLNSESDYYEALTTKRVEAIVDQTPYIAQFSSQYCGMLVSMQNLQNIYLAFVSNACAVFLFCFYICLVL